VGEGGDKKMRMSRAGDGREKATRTSCISEEDWSGRHAECQVGGGMQDGGVEVWESASISNLPRLALRAPCLGRYSFDPPQVPRRLCQE
jgi:hypothetical protein